MNENITKRNELLAQKVMKGLESRNMSAYYAASKEEALAKALELIPEGSSIGMGGCMSAIEIGLVDALKSGNYNFIDRDIAPDPRKAMLDAYDSDVFLVSANAITEDGVIVNIDGNSNRVSAIAQGPRKVVFIFIKHSCNTFRRQTHIYIKISGNIPRTVEFMSVIGTKFPL